MTTKVMKSLNTRYRRKKSKLIHTLDSVIYRILARNPEMEWEISDIQDEIESDWGIRPYGATILRHANNFYREHHIPLFYKTSFETDKYRLNTVVDTAEWEEFFKPRPRGRPRKKASI